MTRTIVDWERWQTSMVHLHWEEVCISSWRSTAAGIQVKIQWDLTGPWQGTTIKETQGIHILNCPEKNCGIFCYSKWIWNYSNKILKLNQNATCPLLKEAKQAFQELKRSLKVAVVSMIDEDKPFQIEMDASNQCIAATLNQEELPVAFSSQTLNVLEKHHSSIEKEVATIVEALREWHY